MFRSSSKFLLFPESQTPRLLPLLAERITSSKFSDGGRSGGPASCPQQCTRPRAEDPPYPAVPYSAVQPRLPEAGVGAAVNTSVVTQAGLLAGGLVFEVARSAPSLVC